MRPAPKYMLLHLQSDLNLRRFPQRLCRDLDDIVPSDLSRSASGGDVLVKEEAEQAVLADDLAA